MANKEVLQKLFNNEPDESCFGKAFLADDAECLKCKEKSYGNECEKWQEAGGDPDAVKKPAKEVKKPAKVKEVKKEEKPAKIKKEKVVSKEPKVRKAMEKDENGFRVGSNCSVFCKMLLEGKYTKEQIETATGTEGKSSVLSFLNLVQKPVGATCLGRGFKVNINEKTNILSVEGKSVKKETKAKK